jgi:cbb3-type cytochrome oxidase maturation protein
VSPADFAVLLTIVGSIVLFGGAAVLALGWAFRSGQFDDLDRGARTIFGPDEPVGVPTDEVLGRGPDR